MDAGAIDPKRHLDSLRDHSRRLADRPERQAEKPTDSKPSR